MTAGLTLSTAHRISDSLWFVIKLLIIAIIVIGDVRRFFKIVERLTLQNNQKALTGFLPIM